MSLRKAAAGYAVIVGLSMIGMWSMLLITGNVPEVKTEPFRLGAHVAAEFATAGLLIVAGFGLLGKNPQTTVVVIDEVSPDNWGIGGKTVTARRRAAR